MKETSIKIKHPDEFGFFDEMEQRNSRLKKIISNVLKVVGVALIVAGLLIALSSVGEPVNGTTELHDIIWQFWIGCMTFAAGAGVVIAGWGVQNV